MSSWNLDLEPLLRGCVTAFMSTRLPRTSATKLTSLLLDYLVGNLKPFIGGEDKIFLMFYKVSSREPSNQVSVDVTFVL